MTNLFINWPNPQLKFYSHFTTQDGSEPQSGLYCYPFVAESAQHRHKDHRHVRFEEDSGRNQSTQHGQRGVAVPLQDVTNTSAIPSKHSPSILTPSKVATYFDQLSSQEPLSPFETSWSTTRHHITFAPLTTSTHSTPLTGRGSYVLRLSPSCSVCALAVNCPKAADTKIVFFSPLAKAELDVQVYPGETQELSGRWAHDT